jgi:hypothetical protein
VSIYYCPIIITGLIKYIVAIVGNTEEGIINVNYKVIIEVLVEVYFKVIAKISAMFIRS